MNDHTSTRASVRKLLIQVLQTDADLTAFCLDYFPVVHSEFSSGMGRTDKLNILLARIDLDKILARLYECRGSDLMLEEGASELSTKTESRVVLTAPSLPYSQHLRHERTYEIWADPAEKLVKATLHGLGYTYQTAFERCLIITTQPINGKSLCIKLLNLMGSTRISVQLIPPVPDGTILISNFFQTFELLSLDH